MASVKVVLRHKSNKKNEFPIALQIIKDRKISVIALGHAILREDWDAAKQRVKKSHPNSARLNNFINKRLAEATDRLLDLETSGKDTSAKVISKSVKGAKEGTFLKQAEIYLKNLTDEGKFNRVSADSPVINRVKEFAKGDVNFSEMDPSFLKRFKAWLIGSRGVGERTAINHYVVIRSIYNQAINAGLVDRKHYPFGRGKVVIKFPDSSKPSLTAEEIDALENAELTPLENHARCVFLLSFYFAGMRISDVLRLKWSDFDNGRLSYTMGKNAKTGSLKTPEKALRLLEPLRRNAELVFDSLDGVDLDDKYAVQFRVKSKLHEINKYLKRAAVKAGITKKLTMHISRHSFAGLAGGKVDPLILQKMYRHSSLLTTLGYMKSFTHKDTDDALDAVLGS
jgi:integrase